MANSIFITPGVFSTSGGTITLLQSTLAWPAGTTLTENTSGKLALAGTTPMLQLGGTTNQSPALKGNTTGAALAVRNADDSGAGSLSMFNCFVGGAISQIGGINTAGSFGASPITAVSEATGLTAADTNRINYTPAAASSSYSINGVVNVTAWTTPASFTVALTYKDASGNARTDTAAVTRGSTGAAAAAITAVDRWYYDFPLIDIDNSATAITVSTTGTFTGSPVYNHAVCLNRLR